MNQPDYCDLHMQQTPCEMCKPTRCLTHCMTLPCSVCSGEPKRRLIAEVTDEHGKKHGIYADTPERIEELERKLTGLEVQINVLSSQLEALRSAK